MESGCAPTSCLEISAPFAKPERFPEGLMTFRVLNMSVSWRAVQEICTYVRTYVCMYVCMYVCTYVRMYVCAYVPMYVCTYVRMYVCTYVRMYVCTYVLMCTYVRMYVCTYVRMYVRWMETVFHDSKLQRLDPLFLFALLAASLIPSGTW